MTTDLFNQTSSSAVISPDGVYRYQLRRYWGDGNDDLRGIMTAPKIGQPVTTADLRALVLDDPAFREALAVALYEVDFDTNPELRYIASAYDLDLYREQADKVLRKLRSGAS